MNRYAVGAAMLFDQLASYLDRELQDCRRIGVEFTTGRCVCGDHGYFTVEWKRAEESERIQTVLAKALTEFLTREWEHMQIRKLIAKKYTYYDADEVDYLAQDTVTFLSSYKRPSANLFRKAEIEREVLQYVKNHPVLNLEGFIRFRLRLYEQDLEYAVEQAIDKYLMEREYHEFVTLLRQFLSSQESRIPLIHLIVNGNWTRLIDHEGNLITDEGLSQYPEDLLNADFMQDDLIISTLITLAPIHVKIHVPNKMAGGEELIDTVKRVFEERVIICDGCTVCQNSAEYWEQSFQLPLDYSK